MPTQNPGTNPNMNNRGPKGPNQNTFDSIAMLDEKFKALRLSVQNQIKFAQNTFKKEIINNPKARDNFIEDIKWQISVLGNFYEDLPTDSDIDSNIVDKNERKKEKSILLKLREKVSKLINDLEKKYCISFDDEMKDMENNSPEKIDERNVGKLNKINSELGSCYSSFFSLYKDLKERKKMQTKLSEEEKMSFGEKLRDVKSAYDISSAELEEMLEDKGVNSLNFSDKVQLILVGKAQNLISEMTTGPSSLLIKIEASLNEKVDDTEKKLDSLYSDTDIITQNASKLLSEVSLECEKMPKGVKLENFDKKRFEELFLQRSKLEGEIIIFRSEHEKFLDDCVSDGGTPDTKRLIKLEVLETKMENIFFLMDMISEKITRNDYMSSKEQRENAKGLSERVGVIENEINTDYDKMGVGDGFSDDKKETYSLMLDVEIINLKHAESNLGGLPDIPENKPTRSLVERVVNRVRERIEGMQEKLEKKRIANEKDILAKLSEAEKEIESVEDDIKETIRRNAEGRQKYKHDKSVADAHNKSAEGKSPHVIVDEYKKPGTYHDQKSVSDDLLDPKKYIEEAKEWIETLPDETDKDQKLKRRLFKKAKRMKRRLSSAKWRHYMTLDAYNKGAYLGDKAGSAIVGVAGDIMDSIFN